MSDLFDLKVGYMTFSNPVAVASMAGTSDSAFFENFPDAGLYILGGYSIDEATMKASKEMSSQGPQRVRLGRYFRSHGVRA